MKKILPLILVALALVGIPAAGHTGTFWSFGFGISSFSGRRYCGVPPVVPVVPNGGTTIVIGSTCGHPYHPYYPSYYNGCGTWFQTGTYLYGGAYHPAPATHCYNYRPYHYHRYPYHPYRRSRIHINNCNNCNICGNTYRYYP